MKTNTILAMIIPALAAAPSLASAQQRQPTELAAAEARAEATVRRMTADEKVVLTHGIFALPYGSAPAPLPEDAIAGAGYVAGIARLGIPSLRETDASLGVTYVSGLRKDGATALPSGLAQAATWNPDLLYRGGEMIGSEARAKGFNVLLAGGANLMRDPRNGRTFEYLAEDPLLTGTLVGAAIRAVEQYHFDDQAFRAQWPGDWPQGGGFADW
jgi:beta-glucosidase